MTCSRNLRGHIPTMEPLRMPPTLKWKDSHDSGVRLAKKVRVGQEGRAKGRARIWLKAVGWGVTKAGGGRGRPKTKRKEERGEEAEEEEKRGESLGRSTPPVTRVCSPSWWCPYRSSQGRPTAPAHSSKSGSSQAERHLSLVKEERISWQTSGHVVIWHARSHGGVTKRCAALSLSRTWEGSRSCMDPRKSKSGPPRNP